MPEFQAGSVSLAVDDDGFVQHPDRWNEEVAGALAQAQGIEQLSDEHWRVIRYLRAYFLAWDTAPAVRKLCKETGLRLQQIYDLFPEGPARGACRIAGLPKPSGCV